MSTATTNLPTLERRSMRFFTRVGILARRKRWVLVIGGILLLIGIVLAVVLSHQRSHPKGLNAENSSIGKSNVQTQLWTVARPKDRQVLVDLSQLADSLMPAPPPAPDKLEKSLQVVDIGPWEPSVVGIIPNGWVVAPDPQREMEYSAPGIKVRVPIYKIVPDPNSIYIIEPGKESGYDIPEMLDASSTHLTREAEIFEATANALDALIPKSAAIKEEDPQETTTRRSR